MIRGLHKLHQQVTVEEQRARWTRELTLIDIADAFPHLPVHKKELEHTLTPDVEGDGYLLFRALLFGFRTAPLLWSRMAARTSRLLQACFPHDEAQHHTYLDDSLWALQGTLARRNVILGFILHTMAAIGFKLSVGKGERGSAVTGVEFKLLSEKEVLLTCRRSSSLTCRRGSKNGRHGRASDSHRETLVAFRGPPQDKVDPEGLLRRDGRQGGRGEVGQGGGEKGRAVRSEKQGRPLCSQAAGGCATGLDSVPQRGEGQAIEKDRTHRPRQSQGEHHHGCLQDWARC